MCHSWIGQDRNFSSALCRKNIMPGASQSISPPICRIINLEPPYRMARPRSRSASKSKHNSKPLYLTSFTARSEVYLDFDDKIIRSERFHITALYAPPFFLILADPSKNWPLLPFTVRKGRRGHFQHLFNSSGGVIHAANAPNSHQLSFCTSSYPYSSSITKQSSVLCFR